jgi:protein-S-isoprenylcysteine O-methyltransferase Ste14
MDPKVQVFGWLMLAPFLVFTVFAFRTFLVPARAAAGPGLMLGALSMFSGITLAVWEGRHGTYQPVLWALGAVLAISAILLYELARRTVTGRGFYSVMSGAVPGAVCADGPYRFIRHPMYAAVLLFIWTAVLSHRSLFTVTVGAIVTLVIAARIVGEERSLRTRYPDYADYARSTKAIVPFIL